MCKCNLYETHKCQDPVVFSFKLLPEKLYKYWDQNWILRSLSYRATFQLIMLGIIFIFPIWLLQYSNLGHVLFFLSEYHQF